MLIYYIFLLEILIFYLNHSLYDELHHNILNRLYIIDYLIVFLMNDMLLILFFYYLYIYFRNLLFIMISLYFYIFLSF